MISAQINTSTVDLQQLKKLSNINDINRLLHETLAKERNIDLELEKVLAKRNVVERSLADLQGGTSELLEVVRADGEGLAASVHNTSAQAEGVSRKVRQLDTAQSRVQETLAAIQLLLQRTHAIDGIRLAMEAGDFETAAEHVRSFLELEKHAGPASLPWDSHQAEEQAQILASAQQKLRGVVRAKLEGAAHSGDHQTVLRYTRLYPPLGLREEGLQWFTQYLQQLIRVRAQDDYNALVDGGKEGAYVTALSNLFKDVADALEANEDFLLDSFGQEAILEVMSGLQQECDVQGTRILQRYIQHRRLPQLMKEISTLDAAKRVEGASADQPHAVDARMVEGYLEEMLVLCQRSEEYNTFMLGKMAEACAPALLGAASENAFRSGQFNVIVRELIAYYINMEEFYVEENVEKAIKIDDYQAEALTSSMVDDVFYILQKSGQRALGSANLQCACAILGQMNNLLASNLRQALDSRWKGAATRLLQVVAGLSPEGQASGKDTGIASEQAAVFNNAETSASYVMKLKAEVEQMGMEVFSSQGDQDRIKSVLADLSKTSSDFKAITNKALDHLANGLVPRLRPVWEEVASMSYEMSEAEYAACEVEDTWVQRLLASLALLLTFLQPFFTPSNWDSLVSILLDKVVDRLEAAMQVKRFNQLGGLQLDRDVRTLVATVSDITQRTVRDKFAKLNQMATILSLESVAEMADYWGEAAGPLTWRLSEAQVREVLGQRVDFSPHDIALLVL